MDITFEIMDEQVLARSLQDAGRRLDNLKDFFMSALDILQKHSDSLFKSDGQAAESVPKWKAHADSTKKARTKRWGYYKNPPNRPGILRWTGKMQDSARKSASNKQGKLEYTDKKALYHWKGGGKNKLPSRKILELSPSVNREITRALQTEIYKQLGLAGLRSTRGL